jgi:hypothetical protein
LKSPPEKAWFGADPGQSSSKHPSAAGFVSENTPLFVPLQSSSNSVQFCPVVWLIVSRRNAAAIDSGNPRLKIHPFEDGQMNPQSVRKGPISADLDSQGSMTGLALILVQKGKCQRGNGLPAKAGKSVA